MNSGPNAHIGNIYKRSPFGFPPTIRTDKNEGGRLTFLLRAASVIGGPDGSAVFPPCLPHRTKDGQDDSLRSRECVSSGILKGQFLLKKSKLCLKCFYCVISRYVLTKFCGSFVVAGLQFSMCHTRRINHPQTILSSPDTQLPTRAACLPASWPRAFRTAFCRGLCQSQV